MRMPRDLVRGLVRRWFRIADRDGRAGARLAHTPYGRVCYWRNDWHVGAALRGGQLFEQALADACLAEHVRDARSIVDIGAHVGCHVLFCAATSPSAHILAIEPQRAMLRLLRRNLALNGLERRVSILPVALSDRQDRGWLARSPDDGPNAGHPVQYGTSQPFNLGGLGLGIGGEAVDITTLDALELGCLDWLKIDVEGAEDRVLAGAMATLHRCRPTILYEHNRKGQGTDPRARLRRLGYRRFTALPGDNVLAEFGRSSSWR